MDATWSRPGSVSEWDLAVELANAVADGGELPIFPSPVLLDSGEVLHGDVLAEGWRFHGADVAYAAPRAVAIGGPLMFGMVAAGSAAGVPVLVGTCLDEWKLFAFLDPAPVDDALLETRLGKVFGDGAAAAAVYRDALGDLPPKELFGAAVTDLVFRQPAIRLSEALVANGSPTFSYLFTWPSPTMGGLMGACHAIEVPFVFGNLDAAGLSMLLGDDPPASVVDAVQASWLAFARTGDPSNDVVGAWPAYDTDRRATMRLDVHTEVLDDPEHERRQLWAGLT